MAAWETLKRGSLVWPFQQASEHQRLFGTMPHDPPTTRKVLVALSALNVPVPLCLSFSFYVSLFLSLSISFFLSVFLSICLSLCIYFSSVISFPSLNLLLCVSGA